MSFPFYIARRYLFSKKSTHAINVISLISVIGVAVATMALVVVLSGFNGFSDLVASFFTNFDPQLKIEAAKGKTIAADNPLLHKIKALPSIEVATECVTDQALATYQGKQMMVMVKGVSENFDSLTNISHILMGDGTFKLNTANLDYGILGVGVAQQLNTGIEWNNYLHIYAPQRKGQYDTSNPTNAFVADSLLSPKTVFQVKQGKYDNNYIITSLPFARRLFNRQGEITSLELRLKAGEDIDKVKSEIEHIVGNKLVVKDRYEQQADTFNIMHIEKLFAYAFLTFILLVACFNIIGSLSMLMIEEERCTNAAQPRSFRQTDKSGLPVRRTYDFGSRGSHWNYCRTIAVLATTNLRIGKTGQPGRQLCCKCLPYQCPPLGHCRHLCHSHHHRLACRLVSSTIHEQTAH